MINSIQKHIFLFFRKRQRKQHHLKYLFWECTWRCNLQCLHCGSDCTQNSSYPDMPLDDFLSVLETIPNKTKDITVVLTGGEPLLRKDLEIAGLEIRKRGFLWGMVSNGLLYTHERHKALLHAGLGSLTFSIDGLEENHNWLRNNQNSFSAIENAIKIAVSSSQLHFDVVTCVNKKNVNQLFEIYQFLKERNVKAWRLFTITPIGRAKNNPDLHLNKSEFKQLMDFIEEKRNINQIDVKFSCEGYVGKYEMQVRENFFFCRAGINIGSVLIDGSISACPNIDRSFSQGNIYKDSFWNIWNTQYAIFRNREWAKRGQCAHCKEFIYCQGNGLHHWHHDKRNVLVCHYHKSNP